MPLPTDFSVRFGVDQPWSIELLDPTNALAPLQFNVAHHADGTGPAIGVQGDTSVQNTLVTHLPEIASPDDINPLDARVFVNGIQTVSMPGTPLDDLFMVETLPGGGVHSTIMPIESNPFADVELRITTNADVELLDLPGGDGRDRVELLVSTNDTRSFTVDAKSFEFLGAGSLVSGLPGLIAHTVDADGGQILTGKTVMTFDAAVTTTALSGWFITSDVRNLGGFGGIIANFELIHKLKGSGNRIGGLTEHERNIISGNSRYGISIGNTSGNVVQGNYIGTDWTGMERLANNSAGISWTYDVGTVIGGSEPGAGNVISGNGNGLRIFGQNAV